MEKIHRRRESTTAPLSAMFEFWKTGIYFRVNFNYTSAPRPVSLVLPVTVCSMGMNQDKFMYLVCVQVEVCCILQGTVLRRPDCAILSVALRI